VHFLEFLSVLRKRWLYVVIPTLVGLGAAAALSYSTTPIYQATASVYFSLPYGNSANDLYQGSNYTQKQLSSYASLATLPVVLDPVVTKLDLPVTATKLADSVNAVASDDTVLIEIRVTDTSPAAAASISNAVADQLAVVVKDLSPKSAEGRPAVDVSIVAKATEPTVPISPNTTRNMVAGALGGLFCGLLLALARDRLDTRVRKPKDMPGDLATLATVPFDKAARSAPLLNVRGGKSRRTEVFRSLRTNLQFVDVAKPAKVIVVTSSVAAEGKTSTSANLAIVFSEAGLRVLLIDADLRRPRVSQYLDLEGSVGLSNVLIGQVAIEDVLQVCGRDRLDVLASGLLPPNPSELLGSQNMIDLLNMLRLRYDVILIDAPPLLPVTDAAVASVHADGVVVIVRYGKTTKSQLASAVQSLRAVDARILGAVINMAPLKGSDAAMRYDGYGYYQDDAGPQGAQFDTIQASTSPRSNEPAADDKGVPGNSSTNGSLLRPAGVDSEQPADAPVAADGSTGQRSRTDRTGLRLPR